MKFSSYQNKLVERIGLALRKNKAGLITDFDSILSEAESLFKTDEFKFWLSQIGEYPGNEIPTTNPGNNKKLEKCQKSM